MSDDKIKDLEKIIDDQRNKIELDAKYIKKLEKDNLHIMSSLNIERDELRMNIDRYDEFINDVISKSEKEILRLNKVKTFLSYPANKKGNIQYSKKSVENHEFEIRCVIESIKSIQDNVSKIKTGKFNY